MTKSLEALIAEMKAAAEKATPGQWRFSLSGANAIVQAPVNMARGGASLVMLCRLMWAGWRNQQKTIDDAKFIAIANPENVLALIAALERKASIEQSSNTEQFAKPLCVKLLPAVDSSNLPFAGNGWNAYREEAIKAILAAGGTVAEGE